MNECGETPVDVLRARRRRRLGAAGSRCLQALQNLVCSQAPVHFLLDCIVVGLDDSTQFREILTPKLTR